MLPQYKRYWAEVDLDTAANNYKLIKKRLSDNTKFCCVIKANGYGHGAVQLARLYEELGADYFAVSNIEEALELRQNGLKLPILILGYTSEECAGLLAENDIEQGVYSLDYAEKLNACAEKSGVKIKIHIKFDTGMGRIGFQCSHEENNKAALKEAAHVCGMKNLIPVGVFTHFAVADEGERGREYTESQFKHFMYAIDYLKNEYGIEFKIRHCANSAAIFEYPQFQLDMVRAGIVLYSPVDSKYVSCPGVKDVISLKSVVSMVKTSEPGDFVSYGCTFSPERKSVLATVPLGYADGFWRFNSNKTSLIVKGEKARIAGRVCMDQLVLDVTDIPGIKAGDIVTVVGKDGNEKISVSDIARENNTISNEILCAIGKRVPRFYIKNGEVVEISHI